MRTASTAARQMGRMVPCVLLTLLATATARAQESRFNLGGSFDAALRPYFEPSSDDALTLSDPGHAAGHMPMLLAPADTDLGVAGDLTFRPQGDGATHSALSLTATGAYLDPSQWSIGLGVGLNGFAVEGSYTTNANLAAQDTLDLGVSYSTGNWSVGFAYQNQGVAVTRNDASESANRLGAGIVYSLGPRLSASASAAAAYNAGATPEAEPELEDLSGVLGFSFRF